MKAKSAIRKLVNRGYKVSTDHINITPQDDGRYVVESDALGDAETFDKPRRAIKEFMKRLREVSQESNGEAPATAAKKSAKPAKVVDKDTPKKKKAGKKKK